MTMEPVTTLPLVSVISPTYNHGQYISRCIGSVLAQTYPAWEMIIIDDGSTDDTAAVAAGYAEQDDRITLVRQANTGIFKLAETYNKALALAKGTYVAVLEGDDYWEEEKLDLQVKAMETHRDAVLCWGQAISTESETNEVIRTYPDPGSPDSVWFSNDPPGSIYHVFLFRNCIPALTMLFRREVLVKTGGFRQNCGLPLVDLPTLYEVAREGKFIFIPQPLGTWRNYAGQMTKVHTATMMEGCRCLALKYINDSGVAAAVGSSVNLKTIRRYYDRQLIISYSRSGRYKLIRKEFKSARKDYLRSIFRYGFHEPVWKIRSITGYIFSLFHGNVEGLSRFLGKTSYA